MSESELKPGSGTVPREPHNLETAGSTPAPATTSKMQALLELESTECAMCHSYKNTKQSFCTRCYYELPFDVRAALYRRFNHGYEEAYDVAKNFLLRKNRARGH